MPKSCSRVLYWKTDSLIGVFPLFQVWFGVFCPSSPSSHHLIFYLSPSYQPHLSLFFNISAFCHLQMMQLNRIYNLEAGVWGRKGRMGEGCSWPEITASKSGSGHGEKKARQKRTGVSLLLTIFRTLPVFLGVIHGAILLSLGTA